LAAEILLCLTGGISIAQGPPESKSHQLVLKLAEPISLDQGNTFGLTIDAGGSPELGVLARVRLSFIDNRPESGKTSRRWGNVRGNFLLSEDAPAPKFLVPAESLVVDEKSGGIANVDWQITNGRFSPHVLTLRQGQPMTLTNKDKNHDRRIAFASPSVTAAWSGAAWHKPPPRQ